MFTCFDPEKVLIGSVQTPTVSVAKASADFVNAQSRHIKAVKSKSSAKRAAPDTNDTDAPPAKKRKTGGGGPWRAFVKKETGGTIGKPDLAAVGEKYRARSENLASELQTEGSEGVTRHRSGENSFGVSVKQPRMLHAKAVRRSEGLQVSGESPSTLSTIVVDQSAMPLDSVRTQVLAKQTLDGVLASSPSWHEYVAGVKNMYKGTLLKRREVLHDQAATLGNYLADGGKSEQLASDVLCKLCDGDGTAVPGGTWRATAPTGSRSISHVKWRSDTLHQRVKDIVSIRPKTAVGQRMNAKLD